jgi:FAD/FMN-containing dehydrogenase
MSKVAYYLQEHLSGEVMTAADARRYFSTDGSVFTVTPALIVYPRNENDVRKTARFTWQLAERGRVIPITARGAGTDQAGAAIGSGIIMAFPAHMHRILELDNKTGVVTVEPGVNFGKLQQTLQTHDRFLPPYPSSIEYSTMGGAVANNTSGEKTVKYGSTRDFVRGLRVVLANGEVIETGRLNKRELSKKLGLSNFEGEIYRSIDALIEEQQEIIKKTGIGVTKNSAGYDLVDVRRKDGSFDLTPLIVGSQGTLGIVTEIVFDTEPYNPNTTLVVSYFDDLQKAQEAVLEMREMRDAPSTLEMVDGNLLEVVTQINPNQLKGIIDRPFPKVILLTEFDDPKESTQRKAAKKAEKIMQGLATEVQVETDPLKQEELWRLRHSAAAVTANTAGQAKALPIIEDGVVPPERFREFVEAVYQLFERYNLQAAMWGHAGDANLHMQPFLDLSQVGDRQKVFKIMDDYYNIVMTLGGSTSGEHGDGRLRAPYLQKLYGPEMYAIFQKVKQIFDPYGTLNPGVKMNVNLETIRPLLRNSFSMEHLYDHLPRM